MKNVMIAALLLTEAGSVLASENVVQVGANYTYANLHVEGQSSFHGNLGGIQGSYEYIPWNGIYGGLRVVWRQGTTSNSEADRKLCYVDVQERVGYSFASCGCDWLLTLFSGFGYRYLGHTLEQSDASPVRFRYNEYYVPVGILSEHYFNSCWSLGANLIWMPQVDPTVGIVPLHGARWNLTNYLGNLLVELPISYHFMGNGCYSIVLKPFYERWGDGRSTAQAFNGQKLGLPKNRYNFWGLELNFSLNF